MADGVEVFESAVRKKNSEFYLVIRLFTDCSIDGPLPLGSILRMDALEPFAPGRWSLVWIESVNAIPFLGEVHGFPSRYPPNPTPHLREPLRFRQMSLAPAQCLFGFFALGNVRHGTHIFYVASGGARRALDNVNVFY